MEGVLKRFAESVALFCELVAVAVIAAAALEAVLHLLWRIRCLSDPTVKKAIWLRFAASILLALEFALAADIARTAISPTWNELGQLAVIAAIRTILNVYLERDLDKAQALKAPLDGG